MNDVLDGLVTIVPGSRLDGLRRRRAVAREQIQAGYQALFEVTDRRVLADRLAVAAFVADLQDTAGATSRHYLDALVRVDADLAGSIADLGCRARQRGPWGSYPEAGLRAESRAGFWYLVPEEQRSGLGERLAVVIEHAHALVLHPRDARADALRRLLDAGWSRAEIVTWSQLVSYVSFQVRVVQGLRALRDSMVDSPKAAVRGAPESGVAEAAQTAGGRPGQVLPSPGVAEVA